MAQMASLHGANDLQVFQKHMSPPSLQRKQSLVWYLCAEDLGLCTSGVSLVSVEGNVYSVVNGNFEQVLIWVFRHHPVIAVIAFCSRESQTLACGPLQS